MAESTRHKNTKLAEAGRTGATECAVDPTDRANRRRLDACGPTRRRVKEVIASVSAENYLRAARNLRDAVGATQRVMVVQTKQEFPAAREAMRKANVGGTIRTRRGSTTTVAKRRR